jgi:hypothetical protein
MLHTKFKFELVQRYGNTKFSTYHLIFFLPTKFSMILHFKFNMLIEHHLLTMFCWNSLELWNMISVVFFIGTWFLPCTFSFFWTFYWVVRLWCTCFIYVCKQHPAEYMLSRSYLFRHNPYSRPYNVLVISTPHYLWHIYRIDALANYSKSLDRWKGICDIFILTLSHTSRLF